MRAVGEEGEGARPAVAPLIRAFLRRTLVRYDRSARGIAKWHVSEALLTETAAEAAEVVDGVSPQLVLLKSPDFAELSKRIESAWADCARRFAQFSYTGAESGATRPFDDTLLVALTSALGVVVWGEKRLYWLDNLPSYTAELISRASARGPRQIQRAESRLRSGSSLRMLRYRSDDSSSGILPGTGGCEREFIYQVKFRLDPQWYVVAEEKPEPGQVAMVERLPLRSARGQVDEIEGARLAALLNATREVILDAAVHRPLPDSQTSTWADSIVRSTASSCVAAYGAETAMGRGISGDTCDIYSCQGVSSAVPESAWRTDSASAERHASGYPRLAAVNAAIVSAASYVPLPQLPSWATWLTGTNADADGSAGEERTRAHLAATVAAAEVRASQDSDGVAVGRSSAEVNLDDAYAQLTTSRSALSRGSNYNRDATAQGTSSDFDIVIHRNRLSAHLARARLHGQNAKLLDAAGEPYNVWAPLDAPPPFGLKYKLGVGITLYLRLLSYLGYGFSVAAVLALPCILANRRGGVLESVGIDAPDALFSLGNREPSGVHLWPSGVIDILFSCLLMLVFLRLKRQAIQLAREVDEGTVTPADYTLLITQVPAHLGTIHNEAEAVAAYTSFFNSLCQMDEHQRPESQQASFLWNWLRRGLGLRFGNSARKDRRGLLPPPDDSSISELVFVRGSARWLDMAIQLVETRRRLDALSGNSANDTKSAVTEAAVCEPCSPNSERAAIARQERVAELKTQEEALCREIEAAAAAAGPESEEVRALLVSFNNVAAMEKVLQELQPTRSLDKLRNAWPFTQLLGTAPLFEFPEASHRDSLFKHISSRLSQRLFYSHPGALPRSFSRIFRTLTFKRLEEEEACCSGENSFRSPTQSYGTPERPIRHPPVADSNRSANDSQPAAAVVGGLARDRLPRPGFMRCRLTARLAPEPSDIVWRSLAWTTSERAARTLCGWLIMLAAILISGWATVAITEAWGKPPPAPAFTHSYQACMSVSYLDYWWRRGDGPATNAHCGIHGAPPIVANDGSPHASGFYDFVDIVANTSCQVEEVKDDAGRGLNGNSITAGGDGSSATPRVQPASRFGLFGSAAPSWLPKGSWRWLTRPRSSTSPSSAATWFSYNDEVVKPVSSPQSVSRGPIQAPFNASDADGRFYHGCEFLGTRGPRGGFLVDVGADRPSFEAFCPFGLQGGGSSRPPPYILSPAELCSADNVAGAMRRMDQARDAAVNASDSVGNGESRSEIPRRLGWNSFEAVQGVQGDGDGRLHEQVASASAVAALLAAQLRGDARQSNSISDHEGLINSYTVEACNDPNCIVCAQAYLACQAASVAAERDDAPIFSVARLEDYRSIGVAVVVLIIAQALFYLATWLSEFSCPVSYSAKQRTFMRYNVIMTFWCTLGTLLYLERDGIGQLGFYLKSGKQIYALLASYVTTKLLILWVTVPLSTLIRERSFARFETTQRDLNACFEGQEFYYALNMAQILFLVIVATAFSSALPLALPLCAAYLLIRYATERLYFVKFYTRTPAYDAKLFHAAYSLLPLALGGKIVATLVLYRDTPDGGYTFYLQSLVFIVWLSVDRGLWGWLLAVRDYGAGTKKPRETEADLAQSTSHRLGRMYGSLSSYDPLPTTFFRSDGERAWAPCFTWENKERLPVFATCPNCFNQVAVNRDSPSARHRCRSLLPKEVRKSGFETDGLLLPPAERERMQALGNQSSIIPDSDSEEEETNVTAAEGADSGSRHTPKRQVESHSKSTWLSRMNDKRPIGSIGESGPGGTRREWWAHSPHETRSTPRSSTPDCNSVFEVEMSRLLPARHIDSTAPKIEHSEHPRTAGGEPTAEDVLARSAPPSHSSWARLPRLGGASALRAFSSWKAARSWIEDHLRVPERAAPLGPSADDTPTDGGERYTYTGMPTLLLPPVSRPPRQDLVVVHDFWDTKHGFRTVHAGPAAPGEECLGVQFVALGRDGESECDHIATLHGNAAEYPMTQPPVGCIPIYKYWDDRRDQFILHPGRGSDEIVSTARGGRVQFAFYAWQSPRDGIAMLPIFEFEHVKTKKRTVHAAPPWEGEEHISPTPLFYALTPSTAYAAALDARGREIATAEVDTIGESQVAELLGVAQRDGVTAASAFGVGLQALVSSYRVPSEYPSQGEGPRHHEWIVGYTRDLSEFGTLAWKILEAGTRAEMSAKLETCLELGNDTTHDGETQHVWECVGVAAELCEPDAEHSSPWTRWVAILRAGGTPRFVGGRLTAARREVDWALRPSTEAVVKRRLADGLQLVAAGGTACAFNVRLLVFSRRIHNWALQYVKTDAEWGRIEEWLRGLGASREGDAAITSEAIQKGEHIPGDFPKPLVESLSFTSGEWTVAAILRLEADVTTHQHILVRAEWPLDEINRFLANGFRVTACARGPLGTKCAVIVVVTSMPASIAPLVYRARGSAFGAPLRWRAVGSPTEWHVDWAQMPLCDSRPLAERRGVSVHASSTEKPPVLQTSRTRVTDVAYSLPWQLGVCAGALFDTLLLLTIASDVIPPENRPAADLFAISLGYAVLCLFTVDILFRLFAEGSSFFHSKWNIFDLCLVLISAGASVYVAIAGGSKVSKQAPVLLRALRAVRAVILALRTLDRLEQGARGRRGPPVQHRAAFVTDGDEGTYWRSERVLKRRLRLPGGAVTGRGASSPRDDPKLVTLTIDLGTERLVDNISTLWGADVVHEMPSRWRILGASEAAFDAEGQRHNEPGMATGHWSLQRPRTLASFDSVSDRLWHRSVQLASADRHVDGVTCSFTALRPPQHLRFIQLEMSQPARNRLSYALRQVQVIGPRENAS